MKLHENRSENRTRLEEDWEVHLQYMTNLGLNESSAVLFHIPCALLESFTGVCAELGGEWICVICGTIAPQTVIDIASLIRCYSFYILEPNREEKIASTIIECQRMIRDKVMDGI